MSSVLEKITLYDILGYLFPGCIFMMMITVSYKKQVLDILSGLGAYTGILYFAFFLVSYLAGIVISEIATDILYILGKTWDIIKSKFCRTGRNADDLLKDKMVSALKNSGISEDINEIENNIDCKSKKYYMSYMYGIVQSSPEYKRIHNYKSAQVMYKNLALVLVAGGIVMCINHTANNCICAGSFIMGGLFMVRCYKFSKKTEKYTIIWFADKFK